MDQNHNFLTNTIVVIKKISYNLKDHNLRSERGRRDNITDERRLFRLWSLNKVSTDKIS